MRSMESYSKTAMERAMAKKITWWQAAEIIAPMREPGFSQSVRVSLRGSLGWTTS